MEAHAALPAAAVDVARRAALDVGVGTGHEVLAAVDVSNVTGGSGSVDVAVDSAAEQGDVGGSGHVATIGDAVVAESAAVGIARHGGSLLNDDVGIVFIGLGVALVHLGRPGQEGVVEVGGVVGDVVVHAVIGFVVTAQRPSVLPHFLPFIQLVGGVGSLNMVGQQVNTDLLIFF